MKTAKCKICKKLLPLKDSYPKGRHDVELIFYEKHKINGLMFCSVGCFREYVKAMFL